MKYRGSSLGLIYFYCMQLESGQPIGFMVIKLVMAGGGRQRKMEDATSVNWLGLMGFFSYYFVLFAVILSAK